uniref:Uncharacterized protein n=1 Tax=Capra hircus TaxID=9925 RepID=A0A452G128_CAPHI
VISTKKKEKCGERHEDAVNELVKEGEMAAEEDSQKTKGTKRKAENVLAR